MRLINLILMIGIVILIIPITSAEQQTLGIFYPGDCVELIQTCANCAEVNISNVLYPNGSVAESFLDMTNSNTYWNYTFCKTEATGEYVVSGLGDVGGTNTVWAYNFFISSYSDKAENIWITVILLAIIVIFNIFAVRKTSKLVSDIIFMATGLAIMFLDISNSYLGLLMLLAGVALALSDLLSPIN